MCVILKKTQTRNINLTSCDDMMESTCKNSHNIKHDVIRAHRGYKTGTDHLKLFTQKTFIPVKQRRNTNSPSVERHRLLSALSLSFSPEELTAPELRQGALQAARLTPTRTRTQTSAVSTACVQPPDCASDWIVRQNTAATRTRWF